MQLPPGVSAPPDHVCRLYCAIYVLKQALCAWFERFRQSLLSTDYTESFVDYVIFYHASPRDIAQILLYIDDMIIIRSDPATITSLKQYLQSQFEMKDINLLHYFLGIVVDSSQGYLLSQQKYISDTRKRATIRSSLADFLSLLPWS